MAARKTSPATPADAPTTAKGGTGAPKYRPQLRLTKDWIAAETSHYVNGFDAATPRTQVGPASPPGSGGDVGPMWRQGHEDHSARSRGFPDGKVSHIDRDGSASAETREARRCLVSQLRAAVADYDGQKYGGADASTRMRLMYTVGGELGAAVERGEISRIPFVSRFVSPDPEAPKNGPDAADAVPQARGFIAEDS